MSEHGQSADATSADAGDSDSVLQSAVWLAQDLGIDLPAVPDVYVDKLQELALGRLYATDRALIALNTRAALADALKSHWPVSGLAFGFMQQGTGGLWFYTLVGGQQIIHVSLRLTCDSASALRATAAPVNRAHMWLDEYLANEANYFRAVVSGPRAGDVPRQVIAFSDEDHVPREAHATWIAGGALSEFVARSDVFLESPGRAETEEMIFRV